MRGTHLHHAQSLPREESWGSRHLHRSNNVSLPVLMAASCCPHGRVDKPESWKPASSPMALQGPFPVCWKGTRSLSHRLHAQDSCRSRSTSSSCSWCSSLAITLFTYLGQCLVFLTPSQGLGQIIASGQSAQEFAPTVAIFDAKQCCCEHASLSDSTAMSAMQPSTRCGASSMASCSHTPG